MLFKSFIQAGFECTTAMNVSGRRLDQIAATQHDQFVEEDYRRLQRLGIQTVREGMRWHLIDHHGRYDFSSFQPFLKAARLTQMQLIVDLFHFGYPADLELLDESFIERFTDYCYAAAKWICREMDGPYFFTPINEPSYFSWAAGEAGLFAPHIKGRGWPLKMHLIRGAISAIQAIRGICPEARIVNADSLCRVVPPPDRPDLQEKADYFNDHAVFQSWDMLSGKLLPELGGNRDILDIVGINYYWTNQWQMDQNGVPLEETDPRKLTLGELVLEVWNRYRGDVMITETSHVNENREPWFREVVRECEMLLLSDVPLAGVCLYPILSMPEWHLDDVWTHMGLWDIVPEDGVMKRKLHLPLLDAIGDARYLEDLRQDTVVRRRVS
jgi:hypothetical protein